jgi:hypothetical protein
MPDNAGVGGLVSAWRSEPVVLVSRLPEHVARERLIEGSVPTLRAGLTLSGLGGYRVVGRVGERRISLRAGKVGVRNSWRPVLRGRLEPDGAGCRLVGRLGLHPYVKVFSAVWLGGVTLVLVGLLVSAVVETNGVALLYCLLPLGFIAFFAGLTALGTRIGRGEAAYLRSWLAERLQTAEAG